MYSVLYGILHASGRCPEQGPLLHCGTLRSSAGAYVSPASKKLSTATVCLSHHWTPLNKVDQEQHQELHLGRFSP